MIDQFIHQEASEVEPKVKELQVRVGNLMVVIVDHVTLKDEGSSMETVMKTVEGIQRDIEELLKCVRMVVPYYTASDDIAALLGRSTRT